MHVSNTKKDKKLLTDITPFDFHGHQVRIITAEDGEPRFVLNDLCAALDIANPRVVAARIDPESKGVCQAYTPGGRQNLTVVDESGMYEVVLRSDKPDAAAFRRWITREVLPDIRRHGGYLTPEKAEQILSDPDTIIHLATNLKEERARRAEVERQNKVYEHQAALDAPKVLFADAVSTSKTNILVGELAKILKGNGVNIGGTRLFAVLRNKGYLINRRGTDWNMPTQKSMELGLFRIKETSVTHSDGHTTVSKTPKITGKGQQYFIERFLDGRLTP